MQLLIQAPGNYLILYPLCFPKKILTIAQILPGESVLLLERVNREFNLRLGCILQHSGKYKSASVVSSAFQSMLFLVNLHNQLDLRVRPEPGKRDLDLLDSALENLWFEIIDLTDQVLRNRILHLSTLPYTLQVVPKKISFYKKVMQHINGNFFWTPGTSV